MPTPRGILEQARTIAVVGASDDPHKPAHKVPALLRDRGWRILPVNPNDPEVLGVPSVASIEELPDGVDVVEVFRPADEAPDVVRAVVKRGIGAVWLQTGIVSEEARALAEEAGVTYVENECMGKLAALEDIYPPA
ncbi:MAG TPA: CoA-binding protein [Frankiaceae bacterium]|nr:CoA-binding protein [Frankiaceae bacterium]